MLLDKAFRTVSLQGVLVARVTHGENLLGDQLLLLRVSIGSLALHRLRAVVRKEALLQHSLLE